MTVIPFPPHTLRGMRGWDQGELDALVEIFAAYAARGLAGRWDLGATECDDPQFYVLGPAPDEDCILSVSRVGRIYVLDDGAGRLLADDPSLDVISAAAMARARRWKRVPLLGRALVALGTMRLVIEEKLEPILFETEELLIRAAPQLAALA